MILKNEKSAPLITRLNDISENLRVQEAPDWFKQARLKGMTRFNDLGIPTVKDEEWKYTNLAGLVKHTFESAANGRLVEKEAFDAYVDRNDHNIVFINGTVSGELSNTGNAVKGVTITTLQEAIAGNDPHIRRLLTAYAVNDEAAFVALNEAINENGVYIRVDEKIVHEGLIHIVHVLSASGKNTVSMPRTLIAAGKSSEITVLESYVAFNNDITYFSNCLTDIFIGENACVHYGKAQKESLGAFHIGHTRVRQERASMFDGFTLTVGSRLTRNDLDIILNGEGANATLNALYSIYNDQHVDNHTSVDHRVPNCTSNQLYKGILNHDARAVFNGKIFVRPIAQQTNSYQLNKNLLLGKNCRVDTKPQLEIFADDVKCTHGATIGQLDEDEMFYLQARGIPRKTATQMLVHGFVNDLFGTIKSDQIRKKINTLMQPSFKALST